MNEAKALRTYAKSIGWQLHRRKGKHEIWVSPIGHRMPLPGTPSGVRTLQNIRAKLRRFAEEPDQRRSE